MVHSKGYNLLQIHVSRPVPKLLKLRFRYRKSHQEKRRIELIHLVEKKSFGGKGMRRIQDWKMRLCGTVCTCALYFLLPGWAFEVNYSLYKYSFIHI